MGGSRLLLAGCVAYGLFANHWSRDSLGALEVPLENRPPYQLTVRQYHSLTSIFFIPNLIVPIVAGVIAQRYGASKTYAAFFALATLGNLLVGLSVLAGQESAFSVLMGGRLLMGLAYEAVDMLPIGFMAPRFQDSWSTTVGMLNGINRLGSVLNFLLEPVLYRAGGLTLALFLPSLVGSSGFLTALLAYRIDTTTSRASSTENQEEAPTARILFTRESVGHVPYLFWLYLLGGACVYGAVRPSRALRKMRPLSRRLAVVPFWFVGAKHLQLKFGLSLEAADALLLFPEGMIAVIAPPFGFLIDRQHWSLSKRLKVSAASLALIPVSLLCLAWLPLWPIFVTLALGVAYALAQNLVWASITLVSPSPLLNLCSGLTGSGLNVLPSFVPLLLFTGDTSIDLTILAAIGGLGVVAYLLAVRESLSRNRTEDAPAAPCRAQSCMMESTELTHNSSRDQEAGRKSVDSS